MEVSPRSTPFLRSNEMTPAPLFLAHKDPSSPSFLIEWPKSRPAYRSLSASADLTENGSAGTSSSGPLGFVMILARHEPTAHPSPCAPAQVFSIRPPAASGNCRPPSVRDRPCTAAPSPGLSTVRHHDRPPPARPQWLNPLNAFRLGAELLLEDDPLKLRQPVFKLGFFKIVFP